MEWKCPWCQGSAARIVRSGIERKVEEFGRAFPHVTVLTSTGANSIPMLPNGNHLVFSTPGVEPRGEYAAEIFLDLESRLLRTTLRATEEMRLQIFRNLSMLAPGGSVYFSLHSTDPFLQSIILGKSAPSARRFLQERDSVQLPPNFTSILIASEEIENVINVFREHKGCEIIGPFLRGGKKTVLLKLAPSERQRTINLLLQMNRIQSMRKLPLLTYQINPYSLN